MEIEHQVVLGVFAALVLAGLFGPSKRKRNSGTVDDQSSPLSFCPSCGLSMVSNAAGFTCSTCGYHYG
ncbi:MAG: hypothetical protein ABJF50_06980 [Paracoccaceae bacterium]